MEINKLMTTNALLEKERPLHMERYAFTQLIIYFTLFLRLSNIEKRHRRAFGQHPIDIQVITSSQFSFA